MMGYTVKSQYDGKYINLVNNMMGNTVKSRASIIYDGKYSQILCSYNV